MEGKLFRCQMQLLRRLTHDLVMPRHTCSAHLHILSSESVYRQDKSRSHHINNQLWQDRDRLTSSHHLVSQFSNRLPQFQRRNVNGLHATHKLATNNMFRNTPACCQVPHRDISFSTQRIMEATPTKIQPYLRLLRFDKPIGTYLLFWPCTWSIGLAAQAGHLPDLYMLTLFGMGSFVMRGSGCIINDMWDSDIDKKVERTKTRPLASGELSPFQGLVFLGGNLSVALAILLQLNWYSVFLGTASMILVIAYPLAKRHTYWPQVVLGLTFNYGAILGWCAVKAGLDWPILPLYAACLFWTLVYDTIYAHQDKYDDMLIGVKSTALKFGDQTKPWLTGFSGVMVGCLALTGQMCDQTWPYYIALAITGSHLTHQLYTVDLNNPDDCLSKFKSNTKLGAIMFVGIVLGTLLKSKEDKDGNKLETKQQC